MTTYDVEVSNQGSIHLVMPSTPEARAWLEEKMDGMWIPLGLVVEARFTVDLLLAMQEDGFVVPLEARGVEA